MYLPHNQLNSSFLLPNSQLSFQQKDNRLHLGRHRQHVWWLGRPAGRNAWLISCPSLISNKPFPSPRSCVGVSRKLSQGSMLALWVCACVFERACPSCASASHVALYSALRRGCSPSGAVALVTSGCEEAAPTQPVTSAAQRVTAQPQTAVWTEKHNHFPHRFISTDSGQDRDTNSVRKGDRQISILLAKIST